MATASSSGERLVHAMGAARGALLTLVLAIVLPGLPAAGAAQSGSFPSAPPPTMPKDIPMASDLYDVALLSAASGRDGKALRDQFASRGLVAADDLGIHVTITGPVGAPPVRESLIADFGGVSDAVFLHCRDAWVPADRLLALARALPEGYRLSAARPPVPCAQDSEGPAATNSISYRDGGADGSGLTIGIMDSGFFGLSGVVATGDGPATYTQVNMTSQPFQSGTDHGTACVETIFDHCPGATYRLYRTDSDTDYGTMVEDAVTYGVDVISVSGNSLGTPWADDTGLPCAAANLAGSQGILFFVSAGNWSEQHYEGTFAPTGVTQRWHDFGAGDTTVDVMADSLGEVRGFLKWETVGGPYDYDLYLYDEHYNLLAQADQGGSDVPEEFAWRNPFPERRLCHLAVSLASGGAARIEIFAIGCTWLEHFVPVGSTASPANSTNPNVIAVGAVDVGDYGFANGATGILWRYSSRGPSNGGMLLPDIIGPTNTRVTVFGPNMSFSGTSAAAPNAAGAASDLWSADTLLRTSAIRWLLLRQALTWRDWGTSGNDNVYGAGGVILYDHAPNTLWVAPLYGNTTNNRAYPLSTITAAEALAVAGGRLVIFPGGEFAETPTLDKALTVEAAGGTARIGGPAVAR